MLHSLHQILKWNWTRPKIITSAKEQSERERERDKTIERYRTKENEIEDGQRETT